MKKNNETYSKGIYDGNKPYVFISYAHEDTKSMENIKSLFEAYGIRYWYDKGLHSGDDWNKVIANHLFKATACVVLLSPESVKSVYVKNELSFAMSHNIPVHALKIKEFDIPIDIQIMTGATQRIDDSKGYEEKLIESLSEDVRTGNHKRTSYLMYKVFKKIRAIAKFVGIAVIAVLVLMSLFSGVSDDAPTLKKTGAVMPSFSDFAMIEACTKKIKGEEITYEYTLNESVETQATKELVNEYINLLTTEYDYIQRGEKIFDGKNVSKWYWFEYTGTEFVTDRTGAFADGTEMGSHDIAINIWNNESRTYLKIFTSQEIEEVNNGEVFEDN